MFFSSFHEILTKIDHILDYLGFIRFKKVKDLPPMLSDYGEIKTEINNNEISRKSSNI